MADGSDGSGAATPRPVRTLPRPAGPPPMDDAQWDEVRGVWEIWDEATRCWVLLDGSGDSIGPLDRTGLTVDAQLALVRAAAAAAAEEAGVPAGARAVDGASDGTDDDVIDLRDAPVTLPPAGERPPGAQWNEVVGRWERWDAGSSSWQPVA